MANNLKHWVITVSQTSSELSDVDDREDNPSGNYEWVGETEEEVLDQFHETVPIGCLDDFEILVEESPHPPVQLKTLVVPNVDFTLLERQRFSLASFMAGANSAAYRPSDAALLVETTPEQLGALFGILTLLDSWSDTHTAKKSGEGHKVNHRDKYLGGADSCPFCGLQEGVEGFFVETGSGRAIQKMRCLFCEKGWTDLYQLIGIEEEI